MILFFFIVIVIMGLAAALITMKSPLRQAPDKNRSLSKQLSGQPKIIQDQRTPAPRSGGYRADASEFRIRPSEKYNVVDRRKQTDAD